MGSRAWVALVAVVAILSPAGAAEAASAIAATRAAQSQTLFERAIALDVGAKGAPNAVRAFEVMRQAAEAGHPEAAFNVAVMLDSSRGAPHNAGDAAVWYARAAVRGVKRAAFNLGMMYEAGDGVPVNVDLSRAWFRACNLPAGREHLAELSSTVDRPERLQPPKPLFPSQDGSLEAGDRQVELVWTSSLEPEPVQYFVELRRLDPDASRETWSGFADVSSVRAPLPAGVRTLAWRVTAVARRSADYSASAWSIFNVPAQ